MLMEEIRKIIRKKREYYLCIRVICLVVMLAAGALAICLGKAGLKLLSGCIEYLMFVLLILLVERRYSLYKMTLVFMDKTDEEFFTKYIEGAFQSYGSLDRWDIPIYGLHSAFHQGEVRLRFLIAGLAVFVPGMTGLVLSVKFSSFPIFLILGGIAALLAMYLDAGLLDKTMRDSYVDLFVKIKNETRNREFTEEQKKVLKKNSKALIYYWKNTENGHSGLDDPEDWKEVKEDRTNYIPHVGQLLREVAVSSHKRFYERNLMISLTIFFAGIILTIIFPYLYESFPGFADYLSLKDLADTVLITVSTLGVVVPVIYYLSTATTLAERKVQFFNNNKLSLYDKFYALRYIAYFVHFKELRPVMFDLQKIKIIRKIDFGRGKFDYAMACTRGIYSDSEMCYKKEKLIDEIQDDYSRLTYKEQAYCAQKEKGQLVISVLSVCFFCLGWALHSLWFCILVLIAGPLLLIGWNLLLYRKVLPIPSVGKMEKMIAQIEENI